MTIEAKVILDSVAPNGVRITTSELLYPRFIHAELMTHRVFSRNAASSRAIPTPKKIERIRKDCAKPSEWGVNVKGMQSAGALDAESTTWAERTWEAAKVEALRHAEMLCGIRCCGCQAFVYLDKDQEKCLNCGVIRLDLHKQVANRILEPFDHICTVVTTTRLNNHRKLRTEVDPLTGRPMPDPTYYELATKWHAALDASKPTPIAVGEWHLPYVHLDLWVQQGLTRHTTRTMSSEDITAIHSWIKEQSIEFNAEVWGQDILQHPKCLEVLKKVSVGRVARTSYMRSGQGDIAENVVLHDRLAKVGHWSPFEAQATPIGGFEFRTLAAEGLEPDAILCCEWCGGDLTEKFVRHLATMQHVCKRCALGHVTSGNFLGWAQYRKEFHGEAGGDD